MEGWGRDVDDKSEQSDKLRLLGAAWERVLAPAAVGKQLSARKAAGRVRCLAEQTARAAGTTMAAALATVLGVNVVNWHHGVQRDGHEGILSILVENCRWGRRR